MEAFELSLTQGIAYAGKSGNPAWVAAIIGVDSHYGLARAFLDAEMVERDHFGCARYTRTYTYYLKPGLYEISQHDERHFRIVWLRKDDKIASRTIGSARATALARLIDGGEEFEVARLATF